MDERTHESKRYRLTDGKTRSRTFSLPEALAEAITEEARRQGHNNSSTIVVLAVTDYLNRQRDPRAA